VHLAYGKQVIVGHRCAGGPQRLRHGRRGALEELLGLVEHPRERRQGQITVELEKPPHDRFAGEQPQSFAERRDRGFFGARFDADGLQTHHGEVERLPAEFGDQRVAAGIAAVQRASADPGLPGDDIHTRPAHADE
jgi:hypothetical protein